MRNAHRNLSEEMTETPQALGNVIMFSASVKYVKILNAELLSACMLRSVS
jgi:hypothetical protein